MGSIWPLRHFLEKQFQNDLAKNELSDTSLFSHFVASLNGPLIFYALLILAVLCVFLFSVGQGLRPRTPQRFAFVILAAWALLPSAAVLALSYISGSLWFPRYLLGFAPYVMVLLAAGFLRLCRWRRLSWVVALLYLGGVGVSLKDYYGPVSYRNNWQAAADMVSQLEQPGDTILYYAPPRYYDYSFPRYYQGDNAIELVTRPRDVKVLEVEHLRENFSGVVPVDSRFWVICWWFCSDEQAVENIVNTLGSKSVLIARREQLDSLGNYPIRLYLFVPATQLTSANGISYGLVE